MTINVLNGAYTSALGRDNRLENVGPQKAQSRNPNVSNNATQAPAPTQLAENVVTQINQAENLPLGVKREAIALATVVDAVAPKGQRQQVLNAVVNQVVNAAPQAADVAPASLTKDEVAQIVARAREQLFGPRPQGEDSVDLTLQARARGVVSQFQEKPVVEAAYNLGNEAVAAIFGSPPGVKQPNAGPDQQLPQLPPRRLPHEQLQHLQEVREQIVDVIES